MSAALADAHSQHGGAGPEVSSAIDGAAHRGERDAGHFHKCPTRQLRPFAFFFGPVRVLQSTVLSKVQIWIIYLKVKLNLKLNGNDHKT